MEVVYTYGVFDLLHYGHIRALKKAKKLGDKLIIGVFTDKVAKGFKRKPILNQKERLLAIKELGLGDVVLLKSLYPSDRDLKKATIVAKAEGAGWDKNNIPQFKDKKSVLLSYTKGISTSEIIKRICSGKY
jgi:glycerol-3-phosphate cytidylyltransferase